MMLPICHEKVSLGSTVTTIGTTGFGQLSSVARTVPASTGATTGATGTIHYNSYDALGRLLNENVDSTTASAVTYDALGRVATATNALSAGTFHTYYLNNTARPASMTYPNGQSTVYTYQGSTGAGEAR